MATMPVIDELDRCKIALQYLAERQSDRLTIVLELLVERLEDAIGQAHAQLRQCTCAGSAPPQATRGSGRRGVLTCLPGSRQTTPPPAPIAPEALDDPEARLCPDASSQAVRPEGKDETAPTARATIMPREGPRRPPGSARPSPC